MLDTIAMVVGYIVLLLSSPGLLAVITGIIVILGKWSYKRVIVIHHNLLKK